MLRRWQVLPLTIPLILIMLGCSLAGAPLRIIWWVCNSLLEHLADFRCWDNWDRPQWRRLILGSWY